MPITQPLPVAQKGRKDARRHREKQREALKKQIPKIIAEEAIITKRKGKIVKVPIKSLQNPRFRQQRRPKDGQGGGQGQGGIGQGPGKPGDVISRRPGQGQHPGGAGQEPGVDYLESEVDIEEIIEMMLEDLGLPNLEDKEVAEIETILGFKITDISRSGPWSFLHRGKSYQEALRRFWAFFYYLKEETGKDDIACCEALRQTNGIIDDALALLQDPEFSPERDDFEPFPIFFFEDLRYLHVEEDVQRESNAVVIAMMDVSGSMGTLKKYLVRSFLFWFVEVLRKIYENVEVRFIIHHTRAKLVEEEDFFKTGESGGTFCYTAYELANSLVDTEYPTSRWNVYPIHFSDGEDWAPVPTVQQARKLIERGVQMLGYGEVHIDEWEEMFVNLLPAFEENFPVSASTVDDVKVVEGQKGFPFLGVVIKGKEDIYPALLQFLKKERWTNA